MQTGPAFAQAVQALQLPVQIVGNRFKVFDEIDSTNRWALDNGREGLVVVADRQSAGRGRQGRTWLSAPGLGLWFTACIEGIVPGLSFAAAMAVHDALAEHNPHVKWPNDVLIRGKKVCGILAEHRSGLTALGIGINVHHAPEDFPHDLREKAGSLESTTGSGFDRVEVLARVLIELDKSVILLRAGAFEQIRARWVGACALVGKTVRRENLTGVVLEIDGEGALVLNTASGVKRFLSGDITILDGE